MKKTKITVTTGTRADYRILRPLLKKIKNSKKLELILIVTGSHLSKNHGNTIEEIIKDGFKISVKINIVPKKDDGFNTSMSIGKGIIEFSKCFKKCSEWVSLLSLLLSHLVSLYPMYITPKAMINPNSIVCTFFIT